MSPTSSAFIFNNVDIIYCQNVRFRSCPNDRSRILQVQFLGCFPDPVRSTNNSGWWFPLVFKYVRRIDLHRLLKKHVHWAWTSKEDDAFQRVKCHLASCKLLAHYDPKLPINLACDASPYGVGAVLSHVMPDGSEKPVAYASRSLASAEKNYSKASAGAARLS